MNALLGVFALLLVLGTQPPASNQPDVPGDLVSIGGHRLFLSCTGPVGQGRTVVFESGGGGTSADWSLVRQQLGPGVRSCAYDRAGLGRSERGPMPRTMHQEIFELHALLGEAKERPPYILVGQSIGGPLVRLYADAYPTEVAGVVLVDPTHESAVLGSVRYGGMVRLREKATGRPIPAPRLSESGAAGEDSEVDYLAEEFQLMYQARQKSPQPLGSRPLVVLAAGKRSPPPPGITADVWTSLRDERDRQVEDLVALSSNARFLRDPTSGHAIHRDNPALVARSIADVRDAAATGVTLSAPRP